MIRHAVLLACISLMLTGCGPTPDDSLRIAVLAPLTGPASDIGQAFVRGAGLAAQDLRENGIPTTLIIEDNKNDPKEGIAAYQRMHLEDPDVLVSTMSGSTQALLPLVQEDRVPLFMSLIITPLHEEYENSYRYFYRGDAYADALVPFLEEHSAHKVAIYAVNTEAGRNAIAPLKERLEEAGISTVTEWHLPGTADHSTSLLKLEASGPDTLFIWSLRPDQVAPYANAAHNGMIVYNEVPASDSHYRTIPDFNGSYVLTPLVTAHGTPERERFLERFGDEHINVAFGYDLVSLIGNASRNVSSSQIVEHVASSCTQGLIGPMNCRGREANAQMVLARVQEGQVIPVTE